MYAALLQGLLDWLTVKVLWRYKNAAIITPEIVYIRPIKANQ